MSDSRRTDPAGRLAAVEEATAKGTAASHPQVDPPTLAEFEGHVVYPMPVFVRLASADPLRIVRFFTEVLDFDVMFRGPEIGGVPVLTHLRRRKYQDVLVVGSQDRVEPGSAIIPTFGAADADDIDALADRVRSRSPDVLDGPADTGWNTRELTVTDPDGNRFTFTAQARQPISGTIDDVMRRAAES